jgi:large subunit ribosomal protein L32
MHQFLTEPSVGICPKCGKAVPGHRACAFCGYYKGREIINVLQKLDRKERKKKEKEMRDVEKEDGKGVQKK